ncbi:energy transducer TonB [Mesonia sp. MT50]|uniref:Energy transducer TonB n=1 Tax=Mesonia profundi TaxID=3070998 RepID=A0ABU1A339_9FLAO|nr:energy transducer TonB [Mesonia profundi]MDQ7918127.1 energy transducer TonB [Mesonia profundi]
MKKYVIILTVLLTSSFGFSQTASGNTVSSKEVAPVWPGCENSAQKSNCFNQMLAKHIQQNFKFPKGYTAEDKGSKVIVSFVVDENGETKILKTSGGRELLQKEAERNILAIPKMKPGHLNGKSRAIKYKVPFTF